MRQLADEADGVGDDVVAVAEAEGARRRVERLEEPVGDRDVGVGERVQQRRLAGVGVAGEGDERDGAADAAGALRAPRLRHALDAPLQRLDAPAHHAAVDLELRLARAAHVDAGAEARQHEALAAHARELVLELRQVHLQRALERVGVSGEHAEDELGAVEDVDVDRVEDGGDLAGAEVVLADGDGRPGVAYDGLELAHLAAPQVRSGLGAVAVLHDLADAVDVGRAQQLLDLDELLVQVGTLAGGRAAARRTRRRADAHPCP